jgi:hypothetical protein
LNDSWIADANNNQQRQKQTKLAALLANSQSLKFFPLHHASSSMRRERGRQNEDVHQLPAWITFVDSAVNIACREEREVMHAFIVTCKPEKMAVSLV